MSRISIIVPIYNVEKYLCRCLDSILAQTYKDLEILLIDDGSIDNSFEIMSKYAQKDCRFKIFKCEHQGVATVRKNGIEWATGDFIGFVDSDDWIEPNMYARLYETIESNKCDLVSIDVFGHYEDGRNVILYDNYEKGLYTNLYKDIYPMMLHDFTRNTKGLLCFLVSKLFRTKILKTVISSIDIRVFYGEDAMIVYRYCLDCKSIYIIREPFYHYDIHSGSAETMPNENEPENMFRLFMNLKQAFEGSPYSDVLMPQLYQYAVFLNTRVLRGLYGIDLGQISSWEFPGFEKYYGKKLVIYGAGACGKALCKELWLHRAADKIMAVVDKNYDKVVQRTDNAPNAFMKIINYVVQPISVIRDLDYDYIVIAIHKESIAEEAARELQAVWDVPNKKIVRINSFKRDIASILSLACL